MDEETVQVEVTETTERVPSAANYHDPESKDRADSDMEEELEEKAKSEGSDLESEEKRKKSKEKPESEGEKSSDGSDSESEEKKKEKKKKKKTQSEDKEKSDEESDGESDKGLKKKSKDKPQSGNKKESEKSDSESEKKEKKSKEKSEPEDKEMSEGSDSESGEKGKKKAKEKSKSKSEDKKNSKEGSDSESENEEKKKSEKKSKSEKKEKSEAESDSRPELKENHKALSNSEQDAETGAKLEAGPVEGGVDVSLPLNLSEEEAETFKALFDMYAEEDQKISRTGIKLFFRYMGECVTDEDVCEWLREVDKDKDGRFDFGEFCQLYSSKREPEDKRREELLVCVNTIFPANGNDHDMLDLRKVKAIMKRVSVGLQRENTLSMSTQEIDEVMERFDKHNNKHISRHEFVDLLINTSKGN